MKKWIIPLSICAVAAGYYYALCAKEYTWVFLSSDSGDWLASSIWWIVPQPMGSPLYLLLGHALNALPGDLVLKMTVGLSVIPAAIAVTFVYLTVNHITGKWWPSVVAAAILLGASIFTTQATVLEEYALATMFLTIAIYFYSKDKLKTAAAFLGLSVAVHAVVLPIVFLWACVEWRRWRELIKPALIFLTTGVLPYIYVPILMSLDTPHLFAGNLTWEYVYMYFMGTPNSIVGNLAIEDAPERLYRVFLFLISSLGLSMLPLYVYLRQKKDKLAWVLIATSAFVFWYFATNFDPSTWTFWTFGLPAVAIMCGVALSRMKPVHTGVILAASIALMAFNAVYVNASTLTGQNPDAMEYKAELMALPDGSAVVARQGAFSMCIFWVMAEDKDLVPIVCDLALSGLQPYVDYLEDEHGITGDNFKEMARDALEDGRTVYWAGLKNGKMEQEKCFVTHGDGFVKTIESVTSYWPERYLEIFAQRGN